MQGNNSFRFLHDKHGGKSVENKSTSGLKLESKWLSSLGTEEKIGARSSARRREHLLSEPPKGLASSH